MSGTQWIVVMGICNVWFKNGSTVKQRNVSAVASRTSGRCMLWKKPENEKFYHKTLQELYTKQMYTFELLWQTTENTRTNHNIQAWLSHYCNNPQCSSWWETCHWHMYYSDGHGLKLAQSLHPLPPSSDRSFVNSILYLHGTNYAQVPSLSEWSSGRRTTSRTEKL